MATMLDEELNPFMEHRWGTRVPLFAPATLQSGDRDAGIAVIVEASISGAFIETQHPVPLLGYVRLWPLALGEAWIDGYVVRVDDEGVAVEWLEPANDVVAALLVLHRDLVPAGATPATSHLR
jgi:hypothetical protein